MTNLDVRAVDERQAFWAPDTPVYPGGRALFGNLIWDLNDQRHSVNRPAVYYVCRFDKLRARWRLLAREICMSQVDIRTLRRQVGTVRRYPMAPRTMSELTIRLRVMARWAGDAGVGLPATWTPDDCDAFVRYVAGRVRHARGVVVAAGDVRSLWTLDPLLSEGGLRFDPWPDVADSEVPKLLGVACPSELAPSAVAQLPTTSAAIVCGLLVFTTSHFSLQVNPPVIRSS